MYSGSDFSLKSPMFCSASLMACRSAGDSKESSGLVALKASSSASLLFLASLLHHHPVPLNKHSTMLYLTTVSAVLLLHPTALTSIVLKPCSTAVFDVYCLIPSLRTTGPCFARVLNVLLHQRPVPVGHHQCAAKRVERRLSLILADISSTGNPFHLSSCLLAVGSSLDCCPVC